MTDSYSPEVTEAISLVWTSYDLASMQRGYAMLADAADAGDGDALCYLGRCYLGEEFVWAGGGFDEDEERAAEYVAESVRCGSASGVLLALRMGILDEELRDEMPFESLREPFERVRAMADAGNPFCQYMVGNAMFWGDWLEIEGGEAAARFDSEEAYDAFAYPVAADYYERSFRGGLTCAWGNYRSIYESDLADVSIDRYEEFFELVTETGDPLVCNDYGKYLQDEYGDHEAAFACYMKALDRGDMPSAYNVAVCYARGEGVAQDLARAFEYYLVAARAGSAHAQFQVGNFYFEGRGPIARDYAVAVPWLERAHAGDGEDVGPMAELALCYQRGWGTPPDDGRAYALLARLEERLDELWEPVDAEVLAALGVAYAFGRGTRRDLERGIAYLDRAVEYGSEEGRRQRARFVRSFFGLGGWRLR